MTGNALFRLWVKPFTTQPTREQKVEALTRKIAFHVDRKAYHAKHLNRHDRALEEAEKLLAEVETEGMD